MFPAIPEVTQEQEDYDDLDELKDKVLGKANGEEGKQPMPE